jgi:hypothetical protein
MELFYTYTAKKSDYLAKKIDTLIQYIWHLFLEIFVDSLSLYEYEAGAS